MSTVTAAAIKSKAVELGFDLCGIAPASDYPELKFFREWIDRGYAGDMAYLNRSADRRADVRNVIESARSVIVTATVYNTNRPYSTECKDPSMAHIARYAWGDDYHDVIGERMERLLEWMRSTSDTPFDARAYVDTGPVQERVYAQYAGIGWIGKNTCVINAEKGSWIFLAEIICSLELEFDRPAFDQCGTCTLCIEACPTKAIVAPGVVDSNRCISYLTIEHRGDIPDEFREAIGTHIYGCDICQEVCPWNATPAVSNDPAWQPRETWDGAIVEELAGRSDDALRTAMRGSAMRRTKVAGLRRNLVVSRHAIGAVDD
ncbi:MAG TPA: tRNA epoxyqueuosine(34) reductase QueG [Vicinamibacterales bacterium]|nr:tRNA epoxyqueuosine(34) reductase QueG [Vicinamibacterales bacterium]